MEFHVALLGDRSQPCAFDGRLQYGLLQHVHVRVCSWALPSPATTPAGNSCINDAILNALLEHGLDHLHHFIHGAWHGERNLFRESCLSVQRMTPQKPKTRTLGGPWH